MNRLIRVRLFFALALATTVCALAFSATRPVDARSTARAATVPEQEALPILPTIVVVADIDPAHADVLPLVIVRPSVDERRAAHALDSQQVATSRSGGGGDFATGLLPKARLDMPYYSFGTLIPSASKD
ncbi:MAG: hypothetical protein J0L88_10265 [Xanthomonadales bacterium]|nr:hypothetical protein [Xanthomonadales bacterium]